MVYWISNTREWLIMLNLKLIKDGNDIRACTNMLYIFVKLSLVNEEEFTDIHTTLWLYSSLVWID